MKTALLVSAFLTSMQAYSMCSVELQYQGTVLGQNVFTYPECREALRECKMAEKTYERENNLSELACVSLGAGPVNPNPNPDPNPNPNPDPYPPGDPYQNYTRLDALRAIEAVENSPQDADANLNIVLDQVSLNVGSLYELTNAFVKLMNLNGGSNSTSETQSMFKTFANMAVRENYSMTEILEAYEVIARAENSATDSLQALGRSQELMKAHRLNLYEAARIYVDILNAEGGSSNTSEALSVMNYLTRMTQREKRSAVSFYLDIRRYETGAQDSLSLLDLVLKAIDVGIQPQEAQGSMISLLQQYGGAATSTIQSKYRNMFRI